MENLGCFIKNLKSYLTTKWSSFGVHRWEALLPRKCWRVRTEATRGIARQTQGNNDPQAHNDHEETGGQASVIMEIILGQVDPRKFMYSFTTMNCAWKVIIITFGLSWSVSSLKMQCGVVNVCMNCMWQQTLTKKLIFVNSFYFKQLEVVITFHLFCCSHIFN